MRAPIHIGVARLPAQLHQRRELPRRRPIDPERPGRAAAVALPPRGIARVAAEHDALAARLEGDRRARDPGAAGGGDPPSAGPRGGGCAGMKGWRQSLAKRTCVAVRPPAGDLAIVPSQVSRRGAPPRASIT